jgi:hypothetical protein
MKAKMWNVWIFSSVLEPEQQYSGGAGAGALTRCGTGNDGSYFNADDAPTNFNLIYLKGFIPLEDFSFKLIQ